MKSNFFENRIKKYSPGESFTLASGEAALVGNYEITFLLHSEEGFKIDIRLSLRGSITTDSEVKQFLALADFYEDPRIVFFKKKGETVRFQKITVTFLGHKKDKNTVILSAKLSGRQSITKQAAVAAARSRAKALGYHLDSFAFAEPEERKWLVVFEASHPKKENMTHVALWVDFYTSKATFKEVWD